MIKANELRAGNLLYSNLTERFFTCSSEDIYNLSMDYNANNANYVKMTEEWLLKAGYKKQNGYGYSNYNIYGLILKNDTGFEFHYYGIIIRIDFVHQLQNLFFSFYGEELVFSTEP